MAESSALKLAHDETLARLREHLDAAYRQTENGLVPLTVGVGIQNALREVDRLEGIGRDWEQAVDDALERERETAENAENGG